MIGDLQADNHGSEASAVNEVDRPQPVGERAAAAFFYSRNRVDCHRRQKWLKIWLVNHYRFVMIRVL